MKTPENSEQLEEIISAQKSLGIHCPVPVVCPVCHGPLKPDCNKPECPDCVQNFRFTDDFPDLIMGERFNDSTDEACMFYEEQSNADLTRYYWFPLFSKYWPDRKDHKPRLLSLGCGTGMDVDILAEEGFEIVGIEIGNRSKSWKSRRHPKRLLLANGFHLPFEDETFDCIYCGCVFPHVGVVGDSFIVADNNYECRLKLASEMSRVLKSDGKIVVSSPNRSFPFDLFHGRKPGTYKPRLNRPGDAFLLSVSNYHKLFKEAGCDHAVALPTQKYWGFIRSKKSLKGFILGLPVRFLFWLTSHFASLRGSTVDPWLVVQIEKGPRA
jgi:SAM-dependent methyltransferase